EIMDEIRLALQEVGRKLKEYLDRKERQEVKKKKEEVIAKILPLIAKKVCEVLEKDPVEVDRIVARIMGYLHVERIVSEKNGLKEVKIVVSNFTKAKREIRILETCSGEVEADNARISEGRFPTITWSLIVNPEEEVELRYRVKGELVNKTPIVEGIDTNMLSVASYNAR
ncbi:MAG: DNA topoisomerase VI subunit B, partial [Archaeoglobi archaeon]|nr:DNA topoisomerase VI subunit B [Archaeoglobi archaeon]